ncbi:MAG: DNA recombination protein RmuC [Candidatus Zixiibacteriota bacterium]|jgi:DNA recombination protein RmuC
MTVLEIVLAVVAVVALAAAAAMFFSTRGAQRRLEDNLARARELNATAAEMAAFRQAVDNRLDSVSSLFANASNAISQQLASASDTVSSVHQGIGEIRESSTRVIELSQNIKKLEDILRPPKTRGIVGEVLLENVLSQVLPAKQFRRQYPLGGTFVDFAVIIGNKFVPVDSKFPLESFERMIRADEGERAGLRRDFVRAVKNKIDDIAAKYIRPDLGTYDFALMYLPSESVYYETAVTDGDLFDYGAAKKVFPVSPATIYVYLATVAMGLRGMALEGRAAAVAAELSRLGDELGKFQELFRVTGKHLRDAANKYDEAGRALGTFQDRLAAAGKLGEGEEDGAPAPLPADETGLFD